MLEIALMTAAGFVLLVLGGEALVHGAVGLADNLGVSKLIIGLVVVGFGTSTPELAASVGAALMGSPGMAIGNIIGSNIANILLILGLTALISPIACDPRAFRRDGPMLGISTLVVAGFVLGGELARVTGVVFIVALLAYLAFVYLSERRAMDDASARLHAGETELGEPAPRSVWAGIALVAAGIGLLVFGADLMVEGAVALARALSISETIVGLTLVALGTSLPELVASLIAAMRRHTDIAFGNIVGSNIFNILGILGVTAVVAPVNVSPGSFLHDVAVLVGASVLLLIFATTGRVLSRGEGAVLAVGYAAYVAFLAQRAGAA